MPARTALPLSANFGLSDLSYCSSGFIYVSGSNYPTGENPYVIEVFL